MSSKRYMAKIKCWVPECANAHDTTANQNLKYFRLPTVSPRKEEWLRFIGLKGDAIPKLVFVCEEHFPLNQFANTLRTKLTSLAIPSIRVAAKQSPVVLAEDHGSLVADIPEIPSTSSGHNEHIPLAQEAGPVAPQLQKRQGILGKIGAKKMELTEREKKMYEIHRHTVATISKYKAKVINLKKLAKRDDIIGLEIELNSVCRNFINSQLKNAGKESKGRRWSNEDKAFALSIYKRSPRIYKYLSLYLELPSKRTLKYMLSTIHLNSGINEVLFNRLKCFVEAMEVENRSCVLMFDEIKLNEHLQYSPHDDIIIGYEDFGHLGRSIKEADHALVFMIKGIRKPWKQPLSYYFVKGTISSNNLRKLIVEHVQMLQSSGINVCATCCDCGPTNVSGVRELVELYPSERPIPYSFSINDQEIVTIFDVPHLLKCTRNALLKCNIVLDGKIVMDWTHITSVVTFDLQKTCRLLPKIKPEYITLSNIKLKMKVKIAAATLSYTMAAVIEAYSLGFGFLPPEAMHSSNFIRRIDKLFDILNSSQSSKEAALSDRDPGQFEFLGEMLSEISRWKLISRDTGEDLTERYPFVKKWQISIRAIMLLWNKVKSEGFRFLFTRNLNQDPIENHFSLVRQHGICNRDPSCFQFIAAFKTILLNRLTSPSAGSNCEEDSGSYLDNLLSLVQTLEDNCDENEDENIEIEIAPEIHEAQELDYQALAYVSGYIFRTFVTTCDKCKEGIYSALPDLEHLFTTLKEYGSQNKLVYVKRNIMTFIHNIQITIFKYLQEHGNIVHVASVFKKQYLTSPCLPNICEEHNPQIIDFILGKSVPFFIHQFTKSKSLRVRTYSL